MLLDEIQTQIKSAMKAKDHVKRDCLRMAVNKAQMIAKEKSSEITDEIILEGISKELKQLNQTKVSLGGVSDSPLFLETLVRIEILNEFVPAAMSEEEIRKVVRETLEAGHYANLGERMKAVMPILKGKADGLTIKKIVQEFC